MTPTTLYVKPDGHRGGDLVLRVPVRAPLGRHTREEDRFVDESELSSINQQAVEGGQPNAVERARQGERIIW